MDDSISLRDIYVLERVIKTIREMAQMDIAEFTTLTASEVITCVAIAFEKALAEVKLADQRDSSGSLSS